MKALVKLFITYETDIPDDPECYEGAKTRGARMRMEKEYLKEGGDYLLQALSVIPHDVKVRIEPIE